MAASRSAGREASARPGLEQQAGEEGAAEREAQIEQEDLALHESEDGEGGGQRGDAAGDQEGEAGDRKSTRLNSKSLMRISYAVFCLNKKKNINNMNTTQTTNQ